MIKQNYIISEGRTGNFVIFGTLTALVGIGLCFANLLLGIGAFVISIILFSATNGLEIKADGSQYRKYGSFFANRTGEWKSMPECNEVLLVISSETKTMRMAIGIPYGGNFNNRGSVMKSITYDIILCTPAGDHILLYEFLKYEDGKKALKAFAETGLKTENRIAMKLAENRARRRAR